MTNRTVWSAALFAAATIAAAPALGQGASAGGAPAPVGQASSAGNAEAGAQKVRMCQGCHGIEGWRTAFPEVYSVPRIAGQHEAYLLKALHEYKNGDRSHPSMRAIAASLSDKDMADLAAYYGQSAVAKVKP